MKMVKKYTYKVPNIQYYFIINIFTIIKIFKQDCSYYYYNVRDNSTGFVYSNDNAGILG